MSSLRQMELFFSGVTGMSPEKAKPVLYWSLALLAGILLPVLTHGLLPLMGIGAIANRLTPESVCMLGFLAIGATVYWAYFQLITKNPWMLVLFSTVFLRVSLYLVGIVEKTGHHIPIRTLMIPIFLFPAIYFLCRHGWEFLRRYPYARFVVAFLAFYIPYFLFFNHNFVDPTVAKFADVSVSKGQVTDYLYGFSILVITCTMFLKTDSAQERLTLFERINRFLVIGTIIESVLTILGYPLNQLTMMVEGFRRSVGFMSHPNEYGKTEGMLLIYFIGLYYYYTKRGRAQEFFVRVLLPVAIVVNMLGFLLSLSKNSFLGFGIACLIYFVSALFDPQLRKRLIIPCAVMAGLLTLTFVGYQAFSGKNLVTLLTDRFQDTRSLEWRSHVWGYLMSHINGRNILFGHGLTASNMEMYRFQYNANMESEKQSIYVHNAFIQFLFDMGLCGLLVFGGMFSAAFIAGKEFFTRHFNPLYLTVIGLALYVLVGTLSDECMTEMQMNLMFWFMITMVFTILWDEARQMAARPAMPEQMA